MLAQLKKGVLEYCILRIVASGEFYGYEIMKSTVAVFSDTSEQTVYTILRRLLADGYTECFSKGFSSGPPRKYYRMTKKGQDYLKSCHDDWKYITACVEKITK